MIFLSIMQILVSILFLLLLKKEISGVKDCSQFSVYYLRKTEKRERRSKEIQPHSPHETDQIKS